MTPNSPSQPVWWGDFDLSVEQPRAWRVGSFRMHLARNRHELGVTWWREGDPADPVMRVDHPVDLPADPTGDQAPPAEAQLERFGFREVPSRVSIRPAMADRPLVVTPIHPFRLPPREESTLFVSVPLWIQLLVDDVVLFEEPLHRLSDTWFGPSTRVGELCYASRTSARLSLANLVVLPQRAMSAVRIRNQARSVLELERMSLPVPNFSLHAGDDGHLWTESVLLEREADGDFAALELGRETPDIAGVTKRVSPARVAPERHTPLRAFGRLLRRGGLHA